MNQYGVQFTGVEPRTINLNYSVTLGYDAGLGGGSKAVVIGYRAGGTANVTNAVVIGANAGVEMKDLSNTICIGSEQKKILIAGKDFSKILERLETLEKRFEELERTCWEPGGPISLAAEKRFYETAKVIESFDKTEKVTESLDET